MQQFFQFRGLSQPVMRLGLATRGNTHLKKDDVFLAFEQGVIYWNWCGHPDAMCEAFRELLPRRKGIVLAVQLEARDSESAHRELENSLEQLRTDYIDIVTFYYVESRAEWQEILAPGGAMQAVRQAREQRLVRMLGLTTHQRALAAELLKEQVLDLLMLRYNAAHRAPEKEIFPLAQELETPLIAFTALRWKALLKSTRDDPQTFVSPPAREWYRFVLSHPAISVALMAPNNRNELLDDLKLLNDWRPPTPQEFAVLREHGDRVRRNAGAFP